MLHYLNRMGVIRSRRLDLLVREIILWCQTSSICLVAGHVIFHSVAMLRWVASFVFEQIILVA